MIAFIGASIVIGIAAVLIGLPLTRLLESSGMERPWTYPVAGFVAGAAVIVIFFSIPGMAQGESLTDILSYTPIGALPGGFCGALWWWSYRRHAREPAGTGRA